MLKILKYSFYDLMRSRWSYVYFAFYLLLGIVLLFLNNDLSKAVITLMNVIIVLVPLIGTIFGVMYYYNSKEFTELLLAQPIKRSSIFLGQYLGVALSLSMSLILGLGIPFVLIRKKGKLPYDKISHEYSLEYGTATIEMHTDAIAKGQRVLVHDDLLATGGSAEAAAILIQQSGGEIAGFNFLVGLNFLNGKDKLLNLSHNIINLADY